MLAHLGYEDPTRCMVETDEGGVRVRCTNVPVFLVTNTEEEDGERAISMSVCASCPSRCLSRCDATGAPLEVLHPRILIPIRPSYLVVIRSGEDSWEGDTRLVGTLEELAEDLAWPAWQTLLSRAELWLRRPMEGADRVRLTRQAADRKEALLSARRARGEAAERATLVRALKRGADPDLAAFLARELDRVEALRVELKSGVEP